MKKMREKTDTPCDICKREMYADEFYFIQYMMEFPLKLDTQFCAIRVQDKAVELFKVCEECFNKYKKLEKDYMEELKIATNSYGQDMKRISEKYLEKLKDKNSL